MKTPQINTEKHRKGPNTADEQIARINTDRHETAPVCTITVPFFADHPPLKVAPAYDPYASCSSAFCIYLCLSVFICG
jgi:hypothetical protein